MSRHGITWKPQGAIPRDIGVTIKMQKLPEVVKPVECPACPECPPPAGCESPAVTSAWSVYDQINGYEKSTDRSLDLTTMTCGFVDTEGFYAGVIIMTPALLGVVTNADWSTAGDANPLWIDLAAITWAISSTTTPDVNGQWFDFTWSIVNGVLVVYGSGGLFGNSVCAFTLATLTAIPSYQGIALPALSLRMLSVCF
jgi:hypothetical protein